MATASPIANPVFDITCFSMAEQAQWRVALESFEQARKHVGPHIVVFGEGSFGDVLQMSPLLHQLRRKFPSARLSFVHPAGLAQAILRGSADVDEVVILRGALHREARLRLITKGWADLVVQCSYVIRYTTPPIRLSRLTEAERSWVLHAQVEQRTWLPLVENFPFDNDKLWRAVTAEGLNLFSLMARTAGFANADFESFQMSLCEADYEKVRGLPSRYVTVSNAAEKLPVTEGLWTKTMPPNKIEQVVAGMRAAGLSVVVLGAKDDAPIRGADVDLRGQTSLGEAGAIINKALCHIGPEGGLANLARAVNTPAVIFFGATPAAFFGFRGNVNVLPRACGGCWWTTSYYLHQCPRLLLEPECTASLSEEAILGAARQFANGRIAQRRRLESAQSVALRSGENALAMVEHARREDFGSGLMSAVSQAAFRIALVAVDAASLRLCLETLPGDVASGVDVTLFVCGLHLLSALHEPDAAAVDVCVCGPVHLPRRDEGYDAVLCPSVAVPQRSASLLVEECNRLLAEGGELVFYSLAETVGQNLRSAYAREGNEGPLDLLARSVSSHPAAEGLTLMRTRISAERAPV